jgi:SAM-dependent methyltransferase
MRDRLLELLVCPVDHGRLRRDDGALVDDHGHRYPIRDGIPWLADPGEQAGTAETFGSKWSLVSEEERDRLAAFQFEWYDKRFGWGSEAGLARHLSGVERVLDAGTGTGYDADRYARLCPGDVVAFDLSESVVAAAERWGERSNLHFAQGDILAPPFAAESFDFVVADQVIHHTPDCARAFRTLASLVRPGGQISVYVYKRKALIRELADEHVRAITTRMSVQECMEFSEQVTELGRELSRLGGRVSLERGVPLLGIEPGEHDVQRLVYWSFLKCFWNEDWDHRLNVLTNFDWYHPPYASRHTEEEMRGWCAECGLDVVHVDVVESGISIRAAKPS